jgi:uncharacterized membrane protein YobD (UPF0266 family)
MEMNPKDRSTILAMAIISIIIFLPITIDPINILNLDQKVILIVTISPILLLLLSYQRQRILKKKEPKNKMEISLKDRLTILAMAFIGMIILLLIAYDPLNILDTSLKWILGLIVAVANVPLLWYQVKRIKSKTK